MTPSSRRPLFLAVVSLAMAASSCTCDGGDITRAKPCTSDADCKDEELPSYCDIRKGICVPSENVCTADFQCCPGQICAQGTLCFDKFTTCAGDSSCTVKGQKCKLMGEQQENGCTFEACGQNGACEAGTNCFNSYCVGEPPCNGGCASGSVCTPVNNRCFPLDPENAPASCKVSCEEGTILVFTDGQNVFNRCDKTKRDCECAALPPVRSDDTARHSNAAATPAKIVVSAYAGAPLGDLVVHTFDRSSLKLESTDWVDGIPTSGAVTGDPKGPRGGRAAPGPDVGQYTSIAFHAATSSVHVAYYAVKDGQKALGDLRYARRSGTTWTKHAVDGTDGTNDTGDVGQYTSIALAPDGSPAIAYFQREGLGNDKYKTALKFARAKSPTPQSAADWVITTIQAGTRTSPPCAIPACKEDEVCTKADSSPNGLCRKKATAQTDCKNPSCGSDEACALNAAGANACFPSLRASTLAGSAEGNGLMPAVAYLDAVPVVVWFDQNKGVLKGVIAQSDGATGAVFQAASIQILDDGKIPGASALALPNVVGQFASIAVGPSDAAKRIAVAYFDTTARQLKVLQAKPNAGKFEDLTPPNLRTADDGKGTPETDSVLFTGADTAIAFDATKNVVVAYQDSTRNDLRIVRQTGGVFGAPTVLAGNDNAAGFYASITGDAANLFVSHAIIKAKSASEAGNKLEIVKIP